MKIFHGKRSFVACCLIWTVQIIAQVPPAMAELKISDRDISDNEYSYRLKFSDLEAPATKFANDVFSQSKVHVVDETGTLRFIAADSGETSATLTFKFDFTDASYRPEAVILVDRITLFPVNPNDIECKSEYSVDGINWTPIAGFRTEKMHHQDSREEFQTELQKSNCFYYRVVFTAIEGAFTGNDNQWGRIEAENMLNAEVFSIKFAMVPFQNPGPSKSSGH